MSNYEFLKEIKLLEGDNFSKEELRQRLNSMNVQYKSNNRRELIKTYNNAIKSIDYVLKIVDKIKTDHSISSIPASTYPIDSKYDTLRDEIKDNKLVNSHKIVTQVISLINSNKQLKQEREKFQLEKRISDEEKKHVEDKPQPSILTPINSINSENDKLNSINSSINDSKTISNKNNSSSNKNENSKEKNNTISIIEFNNNKDTISFITELEINKQSIVIGNNKLLNNELKEEIDNKEEKRVEPQINKKFIFEKYSNSKEFNNNRLKTDQPIFIISKNEVIQINDNKNINQLKTSFSDFKSNKASNNEDKKEPISDKEKVLTIERNFPFNNYDNPQKDTSISFFTKSMIILLGAGIAYAGYRMIITHFDFSTTHTYQSYVPSISISRIFKTLFTSMDKFLSATRRETSYTYYNGILNSLYKLLRIGGGFILNWIFDNIIYISIGLLFVFLYFKLKSVYKNKTFTKRIFKQIRERLRLISLSSSSFDHGLSLDNIVNEYANENSISVQDFNERILPQLVAYGKKDSKIREFNKEINGIVVLYWQWN